MHDELNLNIQTNNAKMQLAKNEKSKDLEYQDKNIGGGLIKVSLRAKVEFNWPNLRKH